VGVESGGESAVFREMPVMLLLPLFLAYREPPARRVLPHPGANTSAVARKRTDERSLTPHTTAREVC